MKPAYLFTTLSSQSRRNKALSVIEACRSLNTSLTTSKIHSHRKPSWDRKKISLRGNLVIECVFINYNVELVLTQDLLGSPFEPHPYQNRNWSNGTEIGSVVNCFVISVLLLQFLFLCLYFTSHVLNSVLFLQFLLWYVNYHSNVFKKEHITQFET